MITWEWSREGRIEYDKLYARGEVCFRCGIANDNDGTIFCEPCNDLYTDWIAYADISADTMFDFCRQQIYVDFFLDL